MTLELAVIIASTRPSRVGIHVARWVHEVAEGHGGFAARLVDLKEVGLPFLDEPKHPRLREYEHEHTRRWSAIVEAADAYVFVTPEYNHGPTPALMNAIDAVFHEWACKPVAFVSYGGVSGGLRAVQTVRMMLGAAEGGGDRRRRDGAVRRATLKDGVFMPNEVQAKAAPAMLDELARWARRSGRSGGDGAASTCRGGPRRSAKTASNIAGGQPAGVGVVARAVVAVEDRERRPRSWRAPWAKGWAARLRPRARSSVSCAMRPEAEHGAEPGQGREAGARGTAGRWRSRPGVGLFSGGTQRTALVTRQSRSCEAVVGVGGEAAVGEAEAGQRGVEQLAGVVAGEGAAGAVGARDARARGRGPAGGASGSPKEGTAPLNQSGWRAAFASR